MEPRGIKSLLYRSVWLPAIVTAILLLIALSLLVSMSWHSLQRLEPMHRHLMLVNRVQDTGLRLQQILVQSITGNTVIDPAELQQVRAEVAEIIALNSHLVPENAERLQKLRILLSELNSHPQVSLIAALSLMRHILSAETRAHDQLLHHVKHNTTIEFEVATGIMIAFPMLALLTLFFLRHRILTPLKNLRTLMSMLAKQDYSSASTANVDPMLLPLFENYNQLVGRLAELEQMHQARQQSLENEVRSATQTLLQQQRSLANAERLAVVGEVAAGVAHELRNPLAGIQMALNNLRAEMRDPEQAERLDIVVTEIKRITRLLNDLLNQSNQDPERLKNLRLAEVTDGLLALARYQVAENVHLQREIPDDLGCRLPEGGLRQALLNLVLNAAEALNERGGTITVAATHVDNHLQLSVSDDGPGFPSNLLETGVRPFATGREHGTGLGLATVRRFARDLNGELLLSNRLPQGACAILSLPCKEY